MSVVVRFAPSPTGLLHVGNARAALINCLLSKQAGGRFLLRIENIDHTRCKPVFEEAIIEDLTWLGLQWDGAPLRQSDRMAAYAAALDQLRARGLLYPCFCTRADIKAEIARASGAPQGPEGPVYPGICRQLPADEAARRMAAGDAHALRLDMEKAEREAGELTWIDHERGSMIAAPGQFGDLVLARKDVPTSYHLAATLDDHEQGITLVTRGEDLLSATHVHRLLQSLLGLSVPEYAHHKLLTDASGRRFAKRDRALTLRALRDAGHTPRAVCDALFAAEPLKALGV